jgi:tetratricopeptide (TPR) repeat protein
LVLEILCDLQAEADMVDEARRTCSELVEYNDEDPETRKRLGDLFLRHGWYEAAYRQYQSLVAMQGDTPLALLRLAAAAAGMGKVDEALRIERKVAAGDGEPGPKDPRRSARLLSVARLAEMLLKARKDKKESTVAALTRSLKRTQVFSARTTLVLLVFEDFAAGLNLALIKDAVPSPVTERVDGKEMGLVMLDFGLSTPDSKNLTVQADDKSLRRGVGYALVTITWDGKDFKIVETKGKVAPPAS